MLTLDFQGRVAVVTGGSGVLAGALATALGRHGARVAVVYHRRLEAAEKTVQAILGAGGKARAFPADVTDRSSLDSLHDAVLKEWGRVDILLNGAGGARREATTDAQRPFFDLPETALRDVVDLNLMGTLLPCQVFGRDLLAAGHGVILNMASVGAVRPLTRSVAYSAAKAAVINFTQWLAVHLAQEYGPGVRVNALVPGFVLTEQNRFLLTEEATGAWTERAQRILSHTPMGRLGTPDDLVGPGLWLMSDLAAFVNGTTVTVDGGLSAFGGV